MISPLLRSLLITLALAALAVGANSVLAQHHNAPARSPKNALWRSALLPGWGQVYNRDYYKVPLIYAGLAGLTALVLNSDQQYRLHQRAALYRQFEEGFSPEDFRGYEPEYQQLSQRYGGELTSATLRDLRDGHGRNRELALLGLGGFYVLAALEAYVSAHLKGFDVGEELTLGVEPVQEGARATLRLRF